MNEWSSKVASSEPVEKRGSRDLESVLEYASRIRAFVGLVEEDEHPPPLPAPLVLDRTPVEVDGEEPVVSPREDALSEETVPVQRNEQEEISSLDSLVLAPPEEDDEKPNSLHLPELVPTENDDELEEKPTSLNLPKLVPSEKDEESEEKPTSLNLPKLVPTENDDELEEKPTLSNLPEVVPVEEGKEDELGELLTSSHLTQAVPLEREGELGEETTSTILQEIVPVETEKDDELGKIPTSSHRPQLTPIEKNVDLGEKSCSSDSSSDSSLSTPDLKEEIFEIIQPPSLDSESKNKIEKRDSHLSDFIDVNLKESDLNGTALEVNLNQVSESSPEFPNMDSGFSDEGPSSALLDNSCKGKEGEVQLVLNGLKSDEGELVEQNGVINNGFDDEGCVKDGIADASDDRSTADVLKARNDINNELPSGSGNDNVQLEEKNSIENEVVKDQNNKDLSVRPKHQLGFPITNQDLVTVGSETDTGESQNIENKEPEVFLFDPEYVEGLQNESSDAKPIPDMALLRRLSQDVVNKVLDDAGTQMREIFNERKRSVIDLSKSAEVGSYTPCSDKNFEEVQLKDVTSSEKNGGSDEPPDMDTLCGIGSYHPKWIQPYATARTYTVLYSIIGMLSGAYYTYLIGTISTLEKRFAFKSKISGTIMIVDEITPLLLGVLVGYFGGKAHRPRMVALGMFLSAVCCFVSAMPYFIYGPATHLNVLNIKNETSLGLCDGQDVQESCDSDDRPPTLAAILFLMLGSFLKGFGNLAYYAIGLAYMDDNAKKKNTPMYFAVSMTLRLVGPLLGFLLSSACLKFYENPFVDPGFGREDPRWIGAWWMGFLLQGVLLLIFVVPIALFPRRISGHKYPAENIDAQVPNFKGLLAALKRLGKNPLFVFIVLNTIMAVFGGFGHYIMLPKYMENQFHMSASDASLLSGPPGLAAVMTSTIIGGSLIWKFKPSAKILTAGMLAVEVIAALGFLILMIPRCERVQMTNFGLTEESLILDSVCNFNCNCTTASYTPVCGPDGRTTFFSPCYAGCSEGLNKTFTNCSCVPESFGEPTVTEGYCVVEDCWPQVLGYIITLPIMQLIVSLMRVAHTMILLRSIEPEDKSVALGTFETLLCAFGFIPFPIVYGSLVDSTCLVWERSCGRTGNCWFYDVDKFNYLLHGASASFSAMSVLCLIVIFLLSGRVNNLYDEDEETVDEKVDSNVIKI